MYTMFCTIHSECIVQNRVYPCSTHIHVLCSVLHVYIHSECIVQNRVYPCSTHIHVLRSVLHVYIHSECIALIYPYVDTVCHTMV